MINVENMKAKEMSNEQIIASCKWLDKAQKENKKILDAYKAELQARGLSEMEERNTRYVKYYGDDGTAAIVDSMKLDILNPDKIKDVVGKGVYQTKVKETTEIKYKCDTKFEKALKAIFTGDYTFEYTLEEFLDEMCIKPDTDQKRLLLRKLKGEFDKDKETLITVLASEEKRPPSFDVELYYIYQIKNAELIKAFLREDMIDAQIEEIRKAIIVETKTAITLDYTEEE